MKKHIFHILGYFCIFLLTACNESIPKDFTESTDTLHIYPDYANTVVPVNIAPLNFKVLTDAEELVVRISANDGDAITTSSSQMQACFPPKKWKELLKNHADEVLTVDLFARNEGKWRHHPSFTLKVVSDSIDRYLTFRLIEPSYSNTGKIGIYEYDMENASMRTLINNMKFHKDPSFRTQRCMNCHTTQQNNPRNSVFHYRTKGGGMIVTYNGKTSIVSTRVGDMVSPAIYERWHPTLPFIVFSNNTMKQLFLTENENIIEPLDNRSDILLYDIEKNEISYVLKSKDKCESYPIWSSDGKYLYYCSTDSLLNNDNSRFFLQKYDLMRLTFDASTRTWSDTTRVFNASAQNKSVSKPRVSPNDKYILMTVSNYGSYHYTHQDADLYLLDLQSNECRPLNELNSSEAEGYATWSSSGRWIMLSSRREDGSYVRLYFSYFDEDGRAHKPFQLPHEDPTFDQSMLKNYNYPEFSTVQSTLSQREIFSLIEEGKSVTPNYSGTIEEMDATSGASELSR